MKLEKKHYIIIAVLVIIILAWYFSKKKKDTESAWWIFSKKPVVPIVETNVSGCVNCWVSSTEDGVEYCRWFDNYGRNTQTYQGRGCTGVQSNIGSSSSKRKPWWMSFFG